MRLFPIVRQHLIVAVIAILASCAPAGDHADDDANGSRTTVTLETDPASDDDVLVRVRNGRIGA